MRTLSATWQYREFIWSSVLREFRSRYRQSILGATWVLLPPLAQVVIYTLVFSALIGARLPGVEDRLGYGIYLCAGIIAWQLFGEIVDRSGRLFVDNGNFIKKMSFPRACLPLIVALGALVNYLVVATLFAVFLVLLGRWPGMAIIGLLPVLAVQALFAVSLGSVVAVLNVFFRDVAQAMQLVMQFWFWLTPIVYPLSILPDPVRAGVAANPMTWIIGAHQRIFLQGQWPEWWPLAAAAGLAAVMAVSGMSLYQRHGSDIVDEL